ncbi:cryptochrome/photolyase family protein [Quadrisphaera setariae]|uniref:Deoxyribodipyrimidine photo-lyase n=1 Tax=Quadrisphaera setariae TaxID=2593304 RepID=A0A5C8Z0Y6_9ACTN|nr:deoxyribodipyrimidine photo-lyase [Quadrisphaera setariae]TXR51735.1 deoxyribodipyrimidine photo-lyase [Quadrisphaera setariae]
MTSTVLWLRRDLRLRDHPALLAAAEEAGGSGVLPLFVLDPALLGPAGPTRTAWLFRSLRAWSASADGALVVRSGEPEDVVRQVAREVGAEHVHVTADAGPYGRARDERVEAALSGDGVGLVRTGTPYAIGPGTVVKGDGTPFQVFTPFSKAWTAHGHPEPATSPPADLRWVRRVDGEGVPDDPEEFTRADLRLPDVGEEAALHRWEAFQDRLDDYDTDRERPDRDGTSQLSAHLKYGEVHPRTLLADLAASRHSGTKGGQTFRTELIWREFYADVLWHRPDSAREYYRPQLAGMRFDDPARGDGKAHLEAWQAGRTGYPFVDAGMRQLLTEGWVHNRVRMVVASFLVKDLHLEWQLGARHFMRWLRDGDLSSNNHGWQWTAGSGTDAAPFFRVFNPVSQGEKFDPSGDYVRRYVPELRHLPGKAAHSPWDYAGGYDHGYPQRIVDHKAEREEALARYAAVRS